VKNFFSDKSQRLTGKSIFKSIDLCRKPTKEIDFSKIAFQGTKVDIFMVREIG
jgi:hypothetical protein